MGKVSSNSVPSNEEALIRRLEEQEGKKFPEEDKSVSSKREKRTTSAVAILKKYESHFKSKNV